MDADEVAAYIRHRLTRVDWQGNPDFEPEAFAAVHRHSGGIPRKVNQLMQRVLLAAALENAELVTAAQVDAVAADLGVDASPRPAARRARACCRSDARTGAGREGLLAPLRAPLA